MDNQQRSLDNDLHWLGGIIDGEGMITAMSRNERNRSGAAFVPRISVVNTDPVIIRECLTILEAVRIPHYVQTKKGRGTWKTKIEILITGYKRVHIALPILLPYIRSKKAQGLKLLALCELRLSAPHPGRAAHAGPYTEQEFGIVKDIRILNGSATAITL